MNPFQLTQQLVWSLSPASPSGSRLVWPSSPGEVVLGRVGVTDGDPDWANLDASRPTALIVPEGDRFSSEHPTDLVEEARWTVLVVVENATDQAGGAAVVGGVRKAGGSSVGRGILEVESLVKARILASTKLVGPRLRATESGPIAPQRLRGIMAARTFKISATRLPAMPAFAPVTRLTAVGAAGSVTLAWGALPDRWDLVGVRVCRASGSTPPSSPTSGVATTTGLTTGYVDAPGAGTWSYALFLAFDSTRNPVDGSRSNPAAVTDFSGSSMGGGSFVYRAATATVTA